ncbi:MAG: hypothetical protein V5A68_07620, partial [Candidatus Thermoplasmatota archaeon]
PSFRPKMTAPQHILQLRQTLKQLNSSNTLKNRHKPRRRIPENRSSQKNMQMISIYTHRVK